MFIVIFLLTDQRNLGMSMKIERSTLDQVKARFAQNKKKLEEKKKDYDLEQRVKELKEEVCSCLKDYAWDYYFIYCKIANRVISIIYRKKRLKSIGRKSERIKREKSKKWLRMMQDPRMRWRQSWDFLVLVRKRSDTPSLSNIHEPFLIFSKKKILFLWENRHGQHNLKTVRNGQMINSFNCNPWKWLENCILFFIFL